MRQEIWPSFVQNSPSVDRRVSVFTIRKESDWMSGLKIPIYCTYNCSKGDILICISATTKWVWEQRRTARPTPTTHCDHRAPCIVAQSGFTPLRCQIGYRWRELSGNLRRATRAFKVWFTASPADVGKAKISNPSVCYTAVLDALHPNGWF